MIPKLYKFVGSPAVRAVKVTALALNITLDEIELDFLKSEHLTHEYLKLNPQHTVPTLDDNGNIICDSHAINSYLVGKYGKDDSLYPKDLYKRALVDQRLAFDLGVLFPLLRYIDIKFIIEGAKYIPTESIKDVKEAYHVLERFLEGKQWIALDYVTIADFSCVTTITCLDYHLKIDPETYPNIVAWIKRCQVLPCFVSDDMDMNVFRKYFDELRSK